MPIRVTHGLSLGEWEHGVGTGLTDEIAPFLENGVFCSTLAGEQLGPRTKWCTIISTCTKPTPVQPSPILAEQCHCRAQPRAHTEIHFKPHTVTARLPVIFVMLEHIPQRACMYSLVWFVFWPKVFENTSSNGEGTLSWVFETRKI